MNRYRVLFDRPGSTSWVRDYVIVTAASPEAARTIVRQSRPHGTKIVRVTRVTS